MSELEELAFVPEDFSGRVRLFPLPNLVLFPHVMQPLHIFEPRYCAMLEDALAGDRMIAMALLSPGWEKNYEGRPAIEPVACLGRIATCQSQPDNRYNLLLLGLRRIRVVRELEPRNPFREAEVEVLEDDYPVAAAAERPLLQRRLVEEFKRVLPHSQDTQEQLDQLLVNNVPLGMLTDIVGYTLDLEIRFKEQLLVEQNVDRRAALLLAKLQAISQDPADPDGREPFPPDFSSN